MFDPSLRTASCRPEPAHSPEGSLISPGVGCPRRASPTLRVHRELSRPDLGGGCRQRRVVVGISRGPDDRDDESFTGQQDVDQEVQAEDRIDPLSEVSSQASTTVKWTGIPSDTTGTIAFAGSSVASDPGRLISSGVTYNQTDMTFKFLETGWLTLHYTPEPGSNGAAYAFNHINILGTPSPLGNQGSIRPSGRATPTTSKSWSRPTRRSRSTWCRKPGLTVRPP